MDLTFQAFHDTLNDKEAQSAACTDVLFANKESIEDLLQLL